VEESAKAIRSAKWWYEIYTYLAGGKQSALWDHAKVIGRKLLPDHDLTALAIPAGIPVLCLPPKDDASIPSVPESFRSIFVFANSDLSRQLHNGPEFVRNWFVNIFHVAHFEATDLLPKAIAATVQRFYDGQIRLSPHDLGLLWEFLKEVIDLSRSIKSDAFWHTTSRLPLPVEFDSSLSDSLPIAMLVPAFACYWPDDHPNSTTAIRGVPGPRRLAPTFIPYLVQTFGHGEDEWHSLLRSAGVSGSPKRLKYVRLVGDREIPFSEELSPELALSAFSGDRQRDENLLALENICGSELWRIHVHSFSPAERSGRTLQEVNLLDRLDACTQAGADLWTEENGDWQTRMWSIVRSVSQSASIGIPDDQLFRRVGGGGGNAIPIKSFLRAQLSQLRWAPSSFGPASPTEAFLRLANRRFVSNGTLEEELGDQLVPYVVADSIEVHEMLKRLGFEPLDDTAASPTALLRFLQLVGIRLSEDGAREQILAVRSRWRLIRGAIQECYRTLNQAAITPTITPDIKLAARLSGLISFVARPVYYAEPGSPLERAFSEDLPLLDADRYYESWYEALAIRRLPGEWVTEKLVGSERAAPSSILRASIIDDLAPYLLATVIAKSEEKDHRELVLRRLKERFEVYVTDRLTIQYTLGGPEPLQRSIDFPKFYMERRVETVGTRENHYSLYVVGRDNAALADLDGDALGDALVPVFFDRVRDDLAALFPRIVSRFQSVDGSKPQMEQFLLESLGISLDSQEMARDDIAGRVEEITPLSPPPPATLLNPSPLPVSAGDSDAKLVDHKTEVIKKLERVIQGFNKNGATTGSNSTNGGKGSSGGGPTREQEARGRRGEEEFLRRIKQPGGWMTFGFVKDTRSLNVGYDFLCSQAEREVAVEIKTFAPGGRVIVTQNELRAASQYGKDYFLIGFVDVGPEAQWHSSVLRNPLSHLLEAGAFDVDVTLQVKAIDVFPH
jgi:hypothetical protein